jgi:hypothetical protein
VNQIARKEGDEEAKAKLKQYVIKRIKTEV